MGLCRAVHPARCWTLCCADTARCTGRSLLPVLIADVASNVEGLFVSALTAPDVARSRHTKACSTKFANVPLGCRETASSGPKSLAARCMRSLPRTLDPGGVAEAIQAHVRQAPASASPTDTEEASRPRSLTGVPARLASHSFRPRICSRRWARSAEGASWPTHAPRPSGSFSICRRQGGSPPCGMEPCAFHERLITGRSFVATSCGSRQRLWRPESPARARCQPRVVGIRIGKSRAGVKAMKFRMLAASLLLAGCSSSTPPTYTLSPWGFAVKECEADHPGYARIDCVASAQERLRPVMALPTAYTTAYTRATCRSDASKFNTVSEFLHPSSSSRARDRSGNIRSGEGQEVEALQERWREPHYRFASTRW